MPRKLKYQSWDDESVKMKAGTELSKMIDKDPVSRLRFLYLQKDGTRAILLLRKIFSDMDVNGTGYVSDKQFHKAIKGTDLSMSDEDVQAMYQKFDVGDTGALKYDDFVAAVRPELNPCRSNLVDMVFTMMDPTGTNKISFSDIKFRYNVTKYSCYLNGEVSSEVILQKFLGIFADCTAHQEELSKEEFLDFYSCLSFGVDEDRYFDFIMRNDYRF